MMNYYFEKAFKKEISLFYDILGKNKKLINLNIKHN